MDSFYFPTESEIANAVVSKSDFLKYEALRQNGAINMLDVMMGCNLTGLTPATYVKIIKNYNKYYEAYYEK